MRAYTSVWRLRFLLGLQYRTAAFAGIATQLFFGFLFIMIFMAFYENGAGGASMSLPDLISYTWLKQIFLTLIMLWYRDNEIFRLITGGNIAYELCRPCGIYGFWYAKLLGQRLAGAALRCLPLLPIALLLPKPYRLGLPPSYANLGLFLLSLAIGLLIVVAVSMLIYISVFWTMSPVGSTLLIAVAGEFFSGMIIPVPLMPDWLQKVSNFLPFRWSADFPFRVYSGHIPFREALLGIGAQLLWIAILIGLGHWLLSKALRRTVIQGG